MCKKPSEHIQIGRGPLATVFACALCKFSIRVPKGRNAGKGLGRGYWLGQTSIARSNVVAHIKAEHCGAVS